MTDAPHSGMSGDFQFGVKMSLLYMHVQKLHEMNTMKLCIYQKKS